MLAVFAAKSRSFQRFIILLILGSLLVIILRNSEGAQSTFKWNGWIHRLSGHIQPKYSPSNDSELPAPKVLDPELRWNGTVPPTKIIAHAPGWTVFDQLYVMEGIMYIVTDSPELVPHPREITSKGQKLEPGNVNLPQLEPTESDLKVISTREARERFGSSSIRISGITLLANESSQYLNHMYHFVAELLFGLWRTYSTLDQGVEINGHTLLPSPSRLVFRHVAMNEWRDYAAMNQFVVRAAFPSMNLEFSDGWEERAAIKGRAFSYDRIVIGDRAAAMHGDIYPATERIAAEAFKLRASPSWWSTIRMAVLEFSKVRKADIIDHVPVITYVSRQKWGRRMLKEKDHLRLVEGLEALRRRRNIEINIVELDQMPRSEQIRVAARSTILIGVHGNGLSTLLWMRPTLQSTVIEFFYPGCFARDYEWTAQALGIGYYGVWNNHAFSSPNLPSRAILEGFQSDHIPLDADTVTQLIERRLDQSNTAWDE